MISVFPRQCSDPEIRFTSISAIEQISGSEGYWQLYDSSAVPALKLVPAPDMANGTNLKATTLAGEKRIPQHDEDNKRSAISRGSHVAVRLSRQKSPSRGPGR
jgi:hypothetical protein